MNSCPYSSEMSNAAPDRIAAGTSSEPSCQPPYQPPEQSPEAPMTLSIILVAMVALTTVAVIAYTHRWSDRTDVVITPHQNWTSRPGSAGNHSVENGRTTAHRRRLSSTRSDPSATTTSPPTRGKYRLSRDVLPIHYNLMISIDPDTTATNYSGEADMLLLCQRSTSSIFIHAANTTQLTQVMLSGDAKVTSTAWGGKHGDVLTLALDRRLQPANQYRLSLQFRNTFGHGGVIGMWTDHDTDPDSHTKRIAYVTCFEPDGARQVFPCFDEPDAKATFNVSILHSTSLMARSNMPLLTSQARGGGLVLDTFDQTPAMSTYLVAWVVSDYKHKVKGRVTVVGPQYIDDNAMSASLDIGYKSLEYVEKFLGIEYPLPKLDLVGTQTFVFGGIEDWGIILFKQEYLFGYSSFPPSSKIYLHEIFHQWLGDLMTNTWWNDIWVQEGPTYYLSQLTTKFVQPNDVTYSVFAADAFAEETQYAGRPALFPEDSAIGQMESEDLFNAVTFSFNSRTHYLMRMIHFLLGDDEFKATLSAVVKKYSYKNLNGYEFLEAMTEMQKTEPRVDINTHMLAWFESDGLPELSFHRNYRNKTVTVRQTQHGDPKRRPPIKTQKTEPEVGMNTHMLPWFKSDGLRALTFHRNYRNKDITVQQTSHGDLKRPIYHIPITYADNRKQDIFHPIRYNDIHWITQESDQLQDTHDDQTAVLLNPGMIGWYAINYDNRNWALIGQYLVQNSKMVDMFMLKQLCYSAYAFHERAETELGSWLWIWEGLKSVTDLSIWYSCLREITEVGIYVAGFNNKDRYQEKALEIWNLTATSAGLWSEGTRAPDNPLQRRVRWYAEDLLCDLDYPQCVDLIQNAWNKDKHHVKSYEEFVNSSSYHKYYERAVLCLIVRHGERLTWENVRSWIDGVKKNNVLQTTIIASLTCSEDDGLLKMAIELTFTHSADWYALYPPVRHDHRFQRAFLDVFFQQTSVHKTELGMVQHAETFVQTNDDLQKFEQWLRGTYEDEELNEHLRAAKKTLAKKKEDEASFKLWLDGRLPSAA